MAQERTIGQVIINGHKLCGSRPKTLRAHVGNDPTITNNPVCQGTIASDAAWETFRMDCNLRGRYVGVSLVESNYLTICEIDIFEWPSKLMALNTN